MPEGLIPTSISSQDWCIEGLYSNVKLDLLTITDGTDVWVSNNLQPVIKLALPVERLRNLAAGRNYSYDVQNIRLDIQPGRIGVAIKLVINNEKKVCSGQTLVLSNLIYTADHPPTLVQ